jgi:hypothetical protein
VFVLPEDDANKDLLNGFLLGTDRLQQVKVLQSAGGWNPVLERFGSEEVKGMRRFPERFMILLIDFDGKSDRLEVAKSAIPDDLADRVFVLGTFTEPEDLKKALGATFETIGSKMADDCRDGTDTIWGHDLLQHNAGELERLRTHVRPILFQPNVAT